MVDDIRPKGCVEVECTGRGWPCSEGRWFFWIGCQDRRLPDGPFVCPDCQRLPENHKPPSVVFELWAIAPGCEPERCGASLYQAGMVDLAGELRRADVHLGLPERTFVVMSRPTVGAIRATN